MFKKAVLFSVVFGGALVTSNMAQADDVKSLLECTKIADDKERLACFDVATKKSIEAGVTQVPVAKAPLTREEQIDNFGQTQLRSSPVKAVREEAKEKQDGMTKITLKVVKVSLNQLKQFILYMDNGQVWKQREGNKIRLPRGEFDVEIKKNRLGSFNMIIPGKKAFVRVKRLR